MCSFDYGFKFFTYDLCSILSVFIGRSQFLIYWKLTIVIILFGIIIIDATDQFILFRLSD